MNCLRSFTLLWVNIGLNIKTKVEECHSSENTLGQKIFTLYIIYCNFVYKVVKCSPYIISKNIFGHTLLAENTSVTNCSLNTSSTFNTEYEQIEFQALIQEIQFVSNNPNKYTIWRQWTAHTPQQFTIFLWGSPEAIPQQSAVFNEMIVLLKCNFESTKSIFFPPFSEYIRMLKYSGDTKIWIIATI